jgi:hypothetical protein
VQRHVIAATISRDGHELSFEQTYYPVMARVVEHWCNNRWGWGRRIVKLQISDEGRWEVYAFSGWGDREWTLVFGDEQRARAEVAELLTEYGPWWDLTVR